MRSHRRLIHASTYIHNRHSETKHLDYSSEYSSSYNSLDALFALDGFVERLQFPAVAFDSQGRILKFNTAAKRLFGWQSDTVIGRAFTSLAPSGAARITLEQAINSLFAEDRPLCYVHEIENRSGAGILCEWDAIIVKDVVKDVGKDTTGIKVAGVAMARKITPQPKHIRHRLREQWLSRLATAITARTPLIDVMRMVRDAVVEASGFDRAGLFLYDRQNNLLRGVWGTDREGRPEDISQQIYAVTDDDSSPMTRMARGELDCFLTCDHYTQQQLPPDNPMYGVRAHALLPLRCNGMVVGVLCVDNLLSDALITHENVEDLIPFADQAAVAIHDAQLLEEVRMAHDALIRAEKLRAVGELASGVAHNVNNIFAVVQGYVELIQEAEGANPEIRHFARIIERAVQDGAAIVQRIQQFARKENSVSSLPLELAQIAQEAIDLTRPAWHNQAMGRGVKIDMVDDLTDGLYIFGVASELREVLVNLIKNAVEAMPDGGVLTIRCYAENNEGVLRIEDTGSGISRDVMSRVFEPFFTTKSFGRGTGLGLSVAWGIVDRHQGRIEVESEPGQGTAFTIRLPLIQSEGLSQNETPEHGNLAGVRLLLVEDEEVVALSVARILTVRGAAVTFVQSADEALEWLEKNSQQCDIILSDHGMQGRTGMELLEIVRDRYPHLHRVLLSGWGNDLPDVQDASAAELILSKPISQSRLVNALLSL